MQKPYSGSGAALTVPDKIGVNAPLVVPKTLK